MRRLTSECDSEDDQSLCICSGSLDDFERLLHNLAALVEDGEVFAHVPDIPGYQGL